MRTDAGYFSRAAGPRRAVPFAGIDFAIGVVCHAGALTLRQPPGYHLLAELLTGICERPATS